MVKLLDKWGRLLYQLLVVGAREVLLEALSKLPRNIRIIFTKSTTADKLAESLMNIMASFDVTVILFLGG